MRVSQYENAERNVLSELDGSHRHGSKAVCILLLLPNLKLSGLGGLLKLDIAVYGLQMVAHPDFG